MKAAENEEVKSRVEKVSIGPRTVLIEPFARWVRSHNHQIASTAGLKAPREAYHRHRKASCETSSGSTIAIMSTGSRNGSRRNRSGQRFRRPSSPEAESSGPKNLHEEDRRDAKATFAVESSRLELRHS